MRFMLLLTLPAVKNERTKSNLVRSWDAVLEFFRSESDVFYVQFFYEYKSL